MARAASPTGQGAARAQAAGRGPLRRSKALSSRRAGAESRGQRRSAPADIARRAPRRRRLTKPAPSLAPSPSGLLGAVGAGGPRKWRAESLRSTEARARADCRRSTDARGLPVCGPFWRRGGCAAGACGESVRVQSRTTAVAETQQQLCRAVGAGSDSIAAFGGRTAASTPTEQPLVSGGGQRLPWPETGPAGAEPWARFWPNLRPTRKPSSE